MAISEVKKKYKTNVEFRKELISQIKQYFIIDNLSRKETADKLEISEAILKSILAENNIFKDRRQVALVSKRTNLERYGNENYVNSEKTKQTCLERYGVENPRQVKEIADKIQKTNQNKYGGNAPACSKLIKNKMKQTCLNRYGVENVFKSENKMQNARKEWNNNKEIIIDKISQTQQNKSQEEKDEILIKRKQTTLDKYGVENIYQDKKFMEQKYLDSLGVNHPWKLERVREKSKQTMIKKYGVPYYVMTDDYQNKIKVISKINLKFAKLLEDNNLKYTMEFKLDKYSFDFHILDTNILIEINPTYTHNSTQGPYFNGKHIVAKDKNYHFEKSKCAEINNYQCIHVFDWDDWNKIINLLKPKEKISGHKCEIREVSKKECDEFLNTYHLQNSCFGQSIRIGLYYKEELISCMTFGKPRYNKNYEFEFLRFANSKYIIRGGVQKLWKYFVEKYQPQSIISYCDFAKFEGKFFEHLNFNFKNKTNITCHWYSYCGKQHFTDNLLRQAGADKLLGTSYGKPEICNLNNREIMINENFVEIYDCGQKVFEWFKIKL